MTNNQKKIFFTLTIILIIFSAIFYRGTQIYNYHQKQKEVLLKEEAEFVKIIEKQYSVSVKE